MGSDGGALLILRKEFPDLPFVELPSYDITYPKKGAWFKMNMLLKLPQIKKTITAEKRLVKQLVSEKKIHGIISDNRMGVRNKKVPSVFITHQLNVLSGNTSFLSSKMHQKIIKKFDECWVPDVDDPVNLTGKLGHPKELNFPVKYIGALSRMEKKEATLKYDVLLLLSGPEPQRTLLEVKMIDSFMDSDQKVLLVRGVVEEENKIYSKNNITIVNFMQSKDLERSINESKLVISRSGYTTIMDLAAMEKDAFFIPTPGQYEQKYLAKQLKQKGIVPSCKQDQFTLQQLNKIPLYSGLRSFKTEIDYEKLFGLFHSE
ncbi:MAG: glycosyltransferase [Aureisphaera sp.]